MFKNHALWLIGESYAGVYVPMLASKIIKYNKTINRRNQEFSKIRNIQQKFKSTDKINLKGLILGNPVMTCYKMPDGKYSYDHAIKFKSLFFHSLLPYRI
jgi:carboxypeptidase C (cathepsin A)